MLLKDAPIQRKLMTVILLTSGAVLLLTCTAFFAYEYLTFRQTTIRQFSTLGQIISTNSTAALVFDDSENADEILTALKAEPHIVAAAIYDKRGNLFSQYPAGMPRDAFPDKPEKNGYYFSHSHLYEFLQIMHEKKTLGTLYLRSDMGAMYERLVLYSGIAALIMTISLSLAFILSKRLQRSISKPIMVLAETARAISDHHDYSVRADKFGNDELGTLTDAFNQMLIQIEEQNLEIRLFNQNLEEKVNERTKELEAFSYSISHDLRAPLRSIDGYSRILLEDYYDKIDEDGKKNLDRIMNNAKMMGRLIDDLLAFSKLGKKELHKIYMDTNEMVNGVLGEMANQTGQRNIDFKIGHLEPSLADMNLIKQVWINLISNAVKYTRNKEKAVIEINSKADDDEVTYHIKDNGAGFEMQYVNKLFGVFQRLHKEKEFEGTGVGLAIVQRIIRSHGGRIWAEGEVNKGASFYFTLPKS